MHVLCAVSFGRVVPSLPSRWTATQKMLLFLGPSTGYPASMVPFENPEREGLAITSSSLQMVLEGQEHNWPAKNRVKRICRRNSSIQMRRTTASYNKTVSHQRCREALVKMVADGVVLKQIEKSNSPEELRKAVGRIHPVFVAGAKSRGVEPDIFLRCPLSQHLRRMSGSEYRSRKFARTAWKELCASRWVDA